MKGGFIIAVDGPAGSGKSSISKEVALKTGLKYIDSGALYRSVTWYFLQKYNEITADISFKEYLVEIKLSQNFLPDGTSVTMVNNVDVSGEIRSEIIAKNIGIISDNVDIRNYINVKLREWAKKESIIMDGRDIGTVVFPNASIKLYLDASVEVRAARRIKEYKEMGKNLDENGIKNQIIQRDKEDKSRHFGRLVQADDAIYLDTTAMTKDQVISKVKEIVVSFKNNG